MCTVGRVEGPDPARREQAGRPVVIPNREGKCCDAVIRQLERAVGATRTVVCDPEVTREGPPVDLRVTLDDQEYVLEHTRILPFDDRIEAAKPYQDISACLGEWFPESLPGDAFYELYLPLGAPRPGRDRRGERRLRGLRDWIEGAVDVLQERAPGRRRWSPHVYERDYFTGRPDGWDCEFTLARLSDGVLPPRKVGLLALFVGSPEEEEERGADGGAAAKRARRDRPHSLRCAARCNETIRNESVSEDGAATTGPPGGFLTYVPVPATLVSQPPLYAHSPTDEQVTQGKSWIPIIKRV